MYVKYDRLMNDILYILLFLELRCLICNQTTSKFRRHLLLHFKDGLICMDEINSILFESRMPRKDSKNPKNSFKPARICNFYSDGHICGKHVLNLKIHLLRFHQLDASGLKFKKILQSSAHCQRNPNIGHLSAALNNPKRRSISEHSVSTSDECYSFNSSRESSPDPITPIIYINKSAVTTNFSNAIAIFKKFQSSSWGGSYPPHTIETDVSNILAIYNSVVEKDLYNPENINSYISQQTKIGRAPTTLLCKIHSFRRFIT